MIPLPTVAITSLLAWTVAAGLAVGAAAVHPSLALVPAVIAAVAVPSALHVRGLPAVVLAVALLGTVAVPFFPAAAWGVAALLAVVALSLRHERSSDTSMDDLQRHIAWCRRREEEADVLVARVSAPDVDPASVRDCFRLTDSVHVERSNGSHKVLAVLDSDDLSRAGVEERVRTTLDPAAELRWARFPADGVTLEVLLAHVDRDEAPRRPRVASVEVAR